MSTTPVSAAGTVVGFTCIVFLLLSSVRPSDAMAGVDRDVYVFPGPGYVVAAPGQGQLAPDFTVSLAFGFSPIQFCPNISYADALWINCVSLQSSGNVTSLFLAPTNSGLPAAYLLNSCGSAGNNVVTVAQAWFSMQPLAVFSTVQTPAGFSLQSHLNLTFSALQDECVYTLFVSDQFMLLEPKAFERLLARQLWFGTSVFGYVQYLVSSTLAPPLSSLGPFRHNLTYAGLSLPKLRLPPPPPTGGPSSSSSWSLPVVVPCSSAPSSAATSEALRGCSWMLSLNVSFNPSQNRSVFLNISSFQDSAGNLYTLASTLTVALAVAPTHVVSIPLLLSQIVSERYEAVYVPDAQGPVRYHLGTPLFGLTSSNFGVTPAAAQLLMSTAISSNLQLLVHYTAAGSPATWLPWTVARSQTLGVAFSANASALEEAGLQFLAQISDPSGLAWYLQLTFVDKFASWSYGVAQAPEVICARGSLRNAHCPQCESMVHQLIHTGDGKFFEANRLLASQAAHSASVSASVSYAADAGLLDLSSFSSSGLSTVGTSMAAFIATSPLAAYVDPAGNSTAGSGVGGATDPASGFSLSTSRSMFNVSALDWLYAIVRPPSLVTSYDAAEVKIANTSMLAAFGNSSFMHDQGFCDAPFSAGVVDFTSFMSDPSNCLAEFLPDGPLLLSQGPSPVVAPISVAADGSALRLVFPPINGTVNWSLFLPDSLLSTQMQQPLLRIAPAASWLLLANRTAGFERRGTLTFVVSNSGSAAATAVSIVLNCSSDVVASPPFVDVPMLAANTSLNLTFSVEGTAGTFGSRVCVATVAAATRLLWLQASTSVVSNPGFFFPVDNGYLIPELEAYAPGASSLLTATAANLDFGDRMYEDSLYESYGGIRDLLLSPPSGTVIDGSVLDMTLTFPMSAWTYLVIDNQRIVAPTIQWALLSSYQSENGLLQDLLPHRRFTKGAVYLAARNFSTGAVTYIFPSAVPNFASLSALPSASPTQTLVLRFTGLPAQSFFEVFVMDRFIMTVISRYSRTLFELNRPLGFGHYTTTDGALVPPLFDRFPTPPSFATFGSTPDVIATAAGPGSWSAAASATSNTSSVIECGPAVAVHNCSAVLPDTTVACVFAIQMTVAFSGWPVSGLAAGVPTACSLVSFSDPTDGSVYQLEHPVLVSIAKTTETVVQIPLANRVGVSNVYEHTYSQPEAGKLSSVESAERVLSEVPISYVQSLFDDFAAGGYSATLLSRNGATKLVSVGAAISPSTVLNATAIVNSAAANFFLGYQLTNLTTGVITRVAAGRNTIYPIAFLRMFNRWFSLPSPVNSGGITCPLGSARNVDCPRCDSITHLMASSEITGGYDSYDLVLSSMQLLNNVSVSVEQPGGQLVGMNQNSSNFVSLNSASVSVAFSPTLCFSTTAFGGKRLLVPVAGLYNASSFPANPLTDFRLVNSSLFGQSCDMLGVSYAAFYAQSNFCDVPMGTCLANQLRAILSDPTTFLPNVVQHASQLSGIVNDSWTSSVPNFRVRITPSMVLELIFAEPTPTASSPYSYSAEVTVDGSALSLQEPLISIQSTTVSVSDVLGHEREAVVSITVVNNGSLPASVVADVVCCPMVTVSGGASAGAVSVGAGSNATALIQVVGVPGTVGSCGCNVSAAVLAQVLWSGNLKRAVVANAAVLTIYGDGYLVPLWQVGLSGATEVIPAAVCRSSTTCLSLALQPSTGSMLVPQPTNTMQVNISFLSSEDIFLARCVPGAGAAISFEFRNIASYQSPRSLWRDIVDDQSNCAPSLAARPSIYLQSLNDSASIVVPSKVTVLASPESAANGSAAMTALGLEFMSSALGEEGAFRLVVMDRFAQREQVPMAMVIDQHMYYYYTGSGSAASVLIPPFYDHQLMSLCLSSSISASPPAATATATSNANPTNATSAVETAMWVRDSATLQAVTQGQIQGCQLADCSSVLFVNGTISTESTSAAPAWTVTVSQVTVVQNGSMEVYPVSPIVLALAPSSPWLTTSLNLRQGAIIAQATELSWPAYLFSNVSLNASNSYHGSNASILVQTLEEDIWTPVSLDAAAVLFLQAIAPAANNTCMVWDSASGLFLVPVRLVANSTADVEAAIWSPQQVPFLMRCAGTSIGSNSMTLFDMKYYVPSLTLAGGWLIRDVSSLNVALCMPPAARSPSDVFGGVPTTHSLYHNLSQTVISYLPDVSNAVTSWSVNVVVNASTCLSLVGQNSIVLQGLSVDGALVVGSPFLSVAVAVPQPNVMSLFANASVIVQSADVSTIRVVPVTLLNDSSCDSLSPGPAAFREQTGFCSQQFGSCTSAPLWDAVLQQSGNFSLSTALHDASPAWMVNASALAGPLSSQPSLLLASRFPQQLSFSALLSWQMVSILEPVLQTVAVSGGIWLSPSTPAAGFVNVSVLNGGGLSANVSVAVACTNSSLVVGPSSPVYAVVAAGSWTTVSVAVAAVSGATGASVCSLLTVAVVQPRDLWSATGKTVSSGSPSLLSSSSNVFVLNGQFVESLAQMEQIYVGSSLRTSCMDPQIDLGCNGVNVTVVAVNGSNETRLHVQLAFSRQSPPSSSWSTATNAPTVSAGVLVGLATALPPVAVAPTGSSSLSGNNNSSSSSSNGAGSSATAALVCQSLAGYSSLTDLLMDLTSVSGAAAGPIVVQNSSGVFSLVQLVARSSVAESNNASSSQLEIVMPSSVVSASSHSLVLEFRLPAFLLLPPVGTGGSVEIFLEASDVFVDMVSWTRFSVPTLQYQQIGNVSAGNSSWFVPVSSAVGSTCVNSTLFPGLSVTVEAAAAVDMAPPVVLLSNASEIGRTSSSNSSQFVQLQVLSWNEGSHLSLSVSNATDPTGRVVRFGAVSLDISTVRNTTLRLSLALDHHLSLVSAATLRSDSPFPPPGTQQMISVPRSFANSLLGLVATGAASGRYSLLVEDPATSAWLPWSSLPTSSFRAALSAASIEQSLLLGDVYRSRWYDWQLSQAVELFLGADPGGVVTGVSWMATFLSQFPLNSSASPLLPEMSTWLVRDMQSYCSVFSVTDVVVDLGTRVSLSSSSFSSSSGVSSDLADLTISLLQQGSSSSSGGGSFSVASSVGLFEVAVALNFTGGNATQSSVLLQLVGSKIVACGPPGAQTVLVSSASSQPLAALFFPLLPSASTAAMATTRMMIPDSCLFDFRNVSATDFLGPQICPVTVSSFVLNASQSAWVYAIAPSPSMVSQPVAEASPGGGWQPSQFNVSQLVASSLEVTDTSIQLRTPWISSSLSVLVGSGHLTVLQPKLAPVNILDWKLISQAAASGSNSSVVVPKKKKQTQTQTVTSEPLAHATWEEKEERSYDSSENVSSASTATHSSENSAGIVAVSGVGTFGANSSALSSAASAVLQIPVTNVGNLSCTVLGVLNCGAFTSGGPVNESLAIAPGATVLFNFTLSSGNTSASSSSTVGGAGALLVEQCSFSASVLNSSSLWDASGSQVAVQSAYSVLSADGEFSSLSVISAMCASSAGGRLTPEPFLYFPGSSWSSSSPLLLEANGSFWMSVAGLTTENTVWTAVQTEPAASSSLLFSKSLSLSVCLPAASTLALSATASVDVAVQCGMDYNQAVLTVAVSPSTVQALSSGTCASVSLNLSVGSFGAGATAVGGTISCSVSIQVPTAQSSSCWSGLGKGVMFSVDTGMPSANLLQLSSSLSGAGAGSSSVCASGAGFWCSLIGSSLVSSLGRSGSMAVAGILMGVLLLTMLVVLRRCLDFWRRRKSRRRHEILQEQEDKEDGGVGATAGSTAEAKKPVAPACLCGRPAEFLCPACPTSRQFFCDSEVCWNWTHSGLVKQSIHRRLSLGNGSNNDPRRSPPSSLAVAWISGSNGGASLGEEDEQQQQQQHQHLLQVGAWHPDDPELTVD